MRVAFVTYQVQPGKRQELLQKIKEHDLERIYSEMPGNMLYCFFLPTAGENRLCLVDIWKDEESFQGHLHGSTTEIWKGLKEQYLEKEGHVYRDYISDEL